MHLKNQKKINLSNLYFSLYFLNENYYANASGDVSLVSTTIFFTPDIGRKQGRIGTQDRYGKLK